MPASAVLGHCMGFAVARLGAVGSVAILVIAAAGAASAGTADPTAEESYKLFVDVCFSHFPDIAAIDEAARGLNLVASDPTKPPVWRQRPSEKILPFRETIYHRGLERFWRRKVDNLSIEVEGFEHGDDGFTCAVSSNAKASDLGRIFKANNPLPRALDHEQPYHDLLQNAVYQLYKVDDRRYIEIMETPYNYDPDHSDIGSNITIMGQGCVLHQCNMMLTQYVAPSMAAKRRNEPSVQTSVPNPPSAKLSSDLFAEVCLENFPDIAAIGDAARAHDLVSPGPGFRNVWWRSLRDRRLAVSHFEDTRGPACHVMSSADEREIISVFETRHNFPLVEEYVQKVAGMTETGVSRLYKVDDDRYVIISVFRGTADSGQTYLATDVYVVGRRYVQR